MRVASSISSQSGDKEKSTSPRRAEGTRRNTAEVPRIAANAGNGNGFPDIVHSSGGAPIEGVGGISANLAFFQPELNGDVVRLPAQAFLAAGKNFENEVRGESV